MMKLGVAIILSLYLAAASSRITQDADSYIERPDITSGANSNETKTCKPMQKLQEEDEYITGRKVALVQDVLWPNGVVPYELHESIESNYFSRDNMTLIQDAMTHWSNNTCISFRRRQPSDESFVIFRSDLEGCYSTVGRNYSGQNISLGRGCWSKETVVHEVGHAIGFVHEHERLDRDEHIEIIWSNIREEACGDFYTKPESNHSVPYDLTSTMQYDHYMGSRDEQVAKTMVTKNPFNQRFLFKSNLLSFRDRLLANLIYNCTDRTSDACKNGGYMRRTTLGDSAGIYSCDCPPNTRGKFCEIKLRDDYYEDLPCGGNVTREGYIQTPGYPNRNQTDMNCAWNITAPDSHRVKLTIEGFNFYPRIQGIDPEIDNKCGPESVEFRLDVSNRYIGVVYCGTDLKPGKVLESNGSFAVIIMEAQNMLNNSGLRAKVSFVPVIDN